MDLGKFLADLFKRLIAVLSGAKLETAKPPSPSMSAHPADVTHDALSYGNAGRQYVTHDDLVLQDVGHEHVAHEDLAYEQVADDTHMPSAIDPGNRHWHQEPVAHEDSSSRAAEASVADHTATAEPLIFTGGADDPNACLTICADLEKEGRLDDAEAAFREATARFPNDLGLHIQFGWLLHRRRDWEAASSVWAVARELAPLHGAGYIGQSVVLRETLRLEEADSFLEKAIKSLPGEKGLYVSYVAVAELRRDWTEALVRWALIRERFPEDPIGWLRAAQASARIGHGDVSVTMLSEVVNHFPGDAKVWTQAIQILWQLGHAEAADQMASEAVARFEMDPVITTLWAEAAVWTRNWRTALERIKTAEQRIGTSAALIALEATCNRELGES